MISYDNFWKTLERKQVTTYALIYKEGISPSVIQRLRADKSITTTTLNTLCSILGCGVSDILEYIPDGEPKKGASKSGRTVKKSL